MQTVLRAGRMGAVLAALMLTGPAAAHAARMSMFVSNGVVHFNYFADPGEQNRLTVHAYAAGNPVCARSQACYEIADAAAAGHVNVGGSCISLDSAYPGQAECELGKLGRTNDSSVHIDIRLGDGSDTVILSTAAAQAIVDAGPGDDVIDTGGDDVNATGGAAQVEVLGGPGNDTLTVRSHSDIMRGNEGNDVFNEPCGDSPPRVDGGLGTDTVSFACSPVGATIDLRHSPRLANLEHVVGSPQADVITCPDRPCTVDAGAGDDTIHGSAHADVLDGGPGDDTIYGGAGNDALTGGPDVDTIYGGPGDDRIDDPNEDGKHFGGPGNDTITAGGALAGGPGDDRLLCTGWPGGNGFTVEESCKLSDGPGDDYVRGADTTGVPPNLGDGDFLVAGPGSDTYDLRRGPDAGTAFYCQVVGPTCGLDIRFRPDTVSYAARGRPVFASVDGKPNDGVKDEHDNIVSAAEIVGGRAGDVLAGSPNRGSTLLGGPGADRLRGGAGNDLLYGGPGADLLIGGGGADQIDGGGGVDTFRCGAGKDQVGDRKRTERAEGCETFAPLPTYPVV